jgi:tetratricopeptide (TPR) repeat protein
VTTTVRTVPALILSVAAVVAAACATSAPRPPASQAAPAASRATAPAAAAAPEADAAGSARVQRLFQEALQAQEDQKKLNVPTDWPYLERKWRAVLDAGELAEARFNLGVSLENEGRLAEAGAEYERALAAKPSLRQAAVNLAVLVEKQGDARGAAAAYAKVVRDFPEDAIARERLAALYLASGQLDEAWRLSREALLRDASSVAAYKVLARVAVSRSELDLAKLVVLRAQKLDAKDPELAFLDGQVLARQGDDAGATAQYRRAIASGEYLPARYALLEGSAKKQAWGAVAEHAQAILRVEPGNAPVHLLLGLAQRHLGKPDEALASYAQAEKLAGGTLPEVHLARGVLYMRVKNACEPAIESFRAYAQAAGPVAATDSLAPKLERECTQILEENRRAAEAAKQMQVEAERKAAEAAAKKAGAKPEATAPADGSAAPTSAQKPVQ